MNDTHTALENFYRMFVELDLMQDIDLMRDNGEMGADVYADCIGVIEAVKVALGQGE